MKKIVFEDASLELIRFGVDVITSSGDIGGGEGGGDVIGTQANEQMPGNNWYGDNEASNIL